jgi:hypothetical protein
MVARWWMGVGARGMSMAARAHMGTRVGARVLPVRVFVCEPATMICMRLDMCTAIGVW